MRAARRGEQPPPGGHPQHQVRQFTVTVRCGEHRSRKVYVSAQTSTDAVLRAGLLLAARASGIDPGQWIVTNVHDPAAR